MRQDFDLDGFLEQPLVARLATTGPTIRPVWFLWEENAFWWLTGSWSALEQHLAFDPRVALVIDTCDLATGEVKQVRAQGAGRSVLSIGGGSARGCSGLACAPWRP